MNFTPPRFALVLLLSTLGGFARAQCPEWNHGFEPTDLAGIGEAAVTHDDGSGPSLFVGGQFISAGGAHASNVARWDGSAWHGVGGGTNGTVQALAVFDEGAGPRLFAAGSFTQADGAAATGIARWDGTSWSAVGGGLAMSYGEWLLDAFCMTTFDDGTGPALYVGGEFTSAGGVSTKGIARWDGTSWSSVGDGVASTSFLWGSVLALQVYDDGSGPQLVVSGEFDRAGTLPVNNLARWNGSSWSGFGTGLLSTRIYTLAVFDEGSGPRLFVGGVIHNIQGPPGSVMARWNGSSWSSLPGVWHQSGVGGALAMIVHDDGSGPQLWVWGTPLLGPPSNAYFARWNGTTWTPILDAPTSMEGAAVFDEGQGPRLFIFGDYGDSGNAARWDGASWSVLHSGSGFAAAVNSAVVVDEPGGEALYLGCGFTYIPGTPERPVVRWDGTSWTNVSGLERPVVVLETLGEGAAERLYAGVSAHQTAHCLWQLENGSWVPVGGAFFFGQGERFVDAVAEFDDGSGPALFVGGLFTSVGIVPASNIAKWNGSTWAPLGSGLSGIVHALKVWDDGTGPALFAAGHFAQAGGLTVNRVAKWNGTSWSALAGGVNPPNSRISDLEVWDDGHGPALYAGGSFTLAGSTPASRIARWNGTTWSAVGGGLGYDDPAARSLHVHDDGSGSGSALYVGGVFAMAGGVPANGLARWNGTSWSNAGGAPSTATTAVRALASYDDGSGAGPALFAGGVFTTLGDVPAQNIARMSGCGSVGEVLCAGDGSGTACPCGNSSAVGEGRGCTHSHGQGARLRANGVPSIAHDSLVLRGDGMTPTSTCLYFQGTQTANGGAGVTFGDGLRCASGTIVRLGVRTNVTGASTWPLAGDKPLSAHVRAPGNVRNYQVWYRDASAFCTPSTFNLSNGLRVVWTD